MAFFYEENQVRGGAPPVPYHDQDANRAWIGHYRNSLMLRFFEQNDPDIRQRAQARRELQICERKLEYWRRHANYDQQRAIRDAEVAKKEWKR